MDSPRVPASKAVSPANRDLRFSMLQVSHFGWRLEGEQEEGAGAALCTDLNGSIDECLRYRLYRSSIRTPRLEARSSGESNATNLQLEGVLGQTRHVAVLVVDLDHFSASGDGVDGVQFEAQAQGTGDFEDR